MAFAADWFVPSCCNSSRRQGAIQLAQQTATFVLPVAMPPPLGLVVQATMRLRAKLSLSVEVVVVWGQYVDSTVVVPAIPGSPLACMVWGSLWEAFVCLVCCILPGHMRSSWSTLQ
jgi:hypothetical protein